MSYNYQDAPSESQSEWLGKKAPELNKNLKPQQFYEWCINLEKRINELEQRQETRPHETIVIGMTGEVIKMGTMYVDDEQLTGVFVMCDPDEFTNQTTNILYRDVKIIPVDECQ